MVTTGYGDLFPKTFYETIWTVYSYYVGFLLAACVIANMTNLVSNQDQG